MNFALISRLCPPSSPLPSHLPSHAGAPVAPKFSCFLVSSSVPFSLLSPLSPSVSSAFLVLFLFFFSGFGAGGRSLLSIVRGACPAFQRPGGLRVPCGGFLWPGRLLCLSGCHSACYAFCEQNPSKIFQKSCGKIWLLSGKGVTLHPQMRQRPTGGTEIMETPGAEKKFKKTAEKFGRFKKSP